MSIQRSRQPAGLSILPFLKRAAVSSWCPDRQSDQTRGSRTSGVVESLLAFLQIRPYRGEEYDYRFPRCPFRQSCVSVVLASHIDLGLCNHLTPREASQRGYTSQIDMD